MIKERNFDFLLNTYKPEFIFAPTELKNIDAQKIHKFDEYSLYKTKFQINYVIDRNLSILLSTSGSTGSPKFVKITSNNIVSNTNSISKYLKIKSNDRAITTMPMNYSYGLSIINTHLANGASIIVTDASLMNKELWELMKDKQATNFGGVPYTYQMLKKLRFERMQLPHLKYITQAGGRLDEELILNFHKICRDKGIDFYVMYGQTEATARMSYLPPASLPEKAGSIGFAIPYGELKLRDDNGIFFDEVNRKGELIYYGENVSAGYSYDYSDLDNSDSNEFLETGDLAIRDQDGYFYIVGRKNRFIKVFGNRVNLDEFETIANRFVENCVCTGAEDKISIYTTAINFNEGDLFSNLMRETGLNSSVFSIKTIDIIPRNESGKVLYNKLK
tara:strand:+ start:5296 stop:6465 length:1170 start_codon:yes stop_codon:yes gene_type:complete